MIRATNGAVYKEMQANLKPYQFQDKNCQSTKCEHMWPVELTMTHSSHMQSVKPAMPQASHMQPVKVIHQSNHKKSQMTQASSTSRKHISIKPEVARNNDMQVVLPTDDLYVGRQMIY